MESGNVMISEETLEDIHSELAAGMALAKCRQCGCMAETLENLAAAFSAVGTDEALAMAQTISTWREAMQPVKYSCLGCEHCYPAVAQNGLTETLPHLELALDLSCDFRVREATWPPVVGEYFVLDEDAPVAVSTLTSAHLAETLADQRPPGLAIAGKSETENIGIDKVIKNVISNPSLQYLIVAGAESEGHLVGQTFLALAGNGVDAQGRVIGARGKRPVLRNVSAGEIATFRQQVQVIDMVGEEDAVHIVSQVEALAAHAVSACSCSACGEAAPLSIADAPTLVAGERGDVVTLDRAGYFVIMPLRDRGIINIEHYAYDNKLLRVIEGTSAREIYHTIIDNGWVTELSHAAYLGKELAKAELSLQHGFKYRQDGA